MKPKKEVDVHVVGVKLAESRVVRPASIVKAEHELAASELAALELGNASPEAVETAREHLSALALELERGYTVRSTRGPASVPAFGRGYTPEDGSDAG